VKKNSLRGFRILKGKRNKHISVKLLAMNGSRFIVLINKYVVGLLWSTKSYEFDQLSSAEFFYEKITHVKLKQRVPLS
jgi:hypothetical protein